jgi:hypothetical protein
MNTTLPLWLAGCTYDINGGNDLRNSGVTAFFYDPGIVNGSPGTTIGVRGGVIGGAGLSVYPGTGMTVNVQPGSFVAPNSASPAAGAYVSTLTSTATLTVEAANPTYSRIDQVVAYVVDTGTSASYGAVEVITGVASSLPIISLPPANSVRLATVTVPAGATSITSGAINDTRAFTTATGGVLVAAKGSVLGYDGMIGYDKTAGVFYHNGTSTTATQMHVLPWKPVVAKLASSVTVASTGVEQTVLSTTITTDGYTDVEIGFKCPAIYSTTTHSGTIIRAFFRMYIDGTEVDTFYSPEANCDTLWQSGVAWNYYTSPATGDTPSAGTHTVSVTVQNTASSVAYGIGATGASSILLRVKPVAM